jgi:hypothetical protein
VRIRRDTDGDNTISVTWTECVSKLGGAAGPPSPSHGQTQDNHGYASGEWIFMDTLMDNSMDNLNAEI